MNDRMRKNILNSLLAACCVLALSGCMKVHTTVVLAPDGSATITERLSFSRRILELGTEQDGAAKFLTKEAALKRMKGMGEQVTLVSHDLRAAEGGGKESVAVFKVPDLNNLRYVSPWPGYKDYATNNAVRFKLRPIYKSLPYRQAKAGTLAVTLHHEKKAQAFPKAKDDPDVGKEKRTPAETQQLRDLLPVFREMLGDFEVRLTFETYAPLRPSGLGIRGGQSGARSVDLLYFNGKHTDKYGDLFVDNEELMLDLVSGDYGSEDIVSHIQGYAGNSSLPVFFPAGSAYAWWTGGTDLSFPPSRQLFERHFAGKDLNYNEWGEKGPPKTVPARFERIGWPRAGQEKDEAPSTESDAKPESEAASEKGAKKAARSKNPSNSPPKNEDK